MAYSQTTPAPPFAFPLEEFAQVLAGWLHQPQTPHEMTKAYYQSHYPAPEDWPQARWKAARLYAAGSFVNAWKDTLESEGWCSVDRASGGISATARLLRVLWQHFSTVTDEGLHSMPGLRTVLGSA